MPFPFLLVAGAVAGGALSAAASSQANRGVKSAVRQQYDAVNENIRQSRLATADEGYRLGQTSMSNIGNYMNALGSKTGASYRAVLAQMYQDASMDQSNLTEGQVNREKAAELEKKSIQISGSNQMQSVPMSIVTGGMGGASFGASLDSAIQGMIAANAAKAQAEASNKIMTSGTPQQQWAVTQGLPAAAVASGQYNDYINRGYDADQNIRTMQTEAARSTANANNAMAKYWQRRLTNFKSRGY